MNSSALFLIYAESPFIWCIRISNCELLIVNCELKLELEFKIEILILNYELDCLTNSSLSLD